MQMCVYTKKNLLGLRPLWAVVVTRLLGECRVLGIYHIARLLLFGSLAITHGISVGMVVHAIAATRSFAGQANADGVPIDTPHRFVSLTVLAARNGPASVCVRHRPLIFLWQENSRKGPL